MPGPFKAIEICDQVYWVGAIDWRLRNFHGYLTSRGSTYNAFLILADKVTLIDSVKPPFFDEMMARIASVVDPTSIDIVISNHAEMDHSGSLPQLIQAVHPKKVIASKNGVSALKNHFHWDQDVIAMGTGDRLDLGSASLRFIEARMLHWPDSMFAFLEGAGVLFSNDAFGMHLATSARFADQVEPWILKYEGAKYFANILLHLSPVVTKLLDQLPSLDLDIKVLAPDHGPVWRKDIDRIVGYYAEWAAQKPTRKAVLVYDTMWQSTANMAAAVCDGLVEGGVQVVQMPLDATHRSNVVTELLDAGALLVGSPTMNNQVYPTVADVMNYLKGLKPKNLVGATFGSFGWSGEAVKHLDRIMEEMNITLVQPGLRLKYVPDDAGLTQCRALGKAVARQLGDR
ncbi:MAG: FprA family A-type flavoprotein [Myxococcota bacterium]|nr:FprA family A-type flavoprotein [Myxococcota bacterium]